MTAIVASEAERVVAANAHAYESTYRNELEREHWGRSALMHAKELVEIFDDGIDAYHAGVERFGLGNFAIMHIGVANTGYLTVLPTD